MVGVAWSLEHRVHRPRARRQRDVERRPPARSGLAVHPKLRIRGLGLNADGRAGRPRSLDGSSGASTARRAGSTRPVAGEVGVTTDGSEVRSPVPRFGSGWGWVRKIPAATAAAATPITTNQVDFRWARLRLAVESNSEAVCRNVDDSGRSWDSTRVPPATGAGNRCEPVDGGSGVL